MKETTRKHSLRLTILVLVLALNLSFISALMAKTTSSNQDLIIEKLQQLQTDVSGLPQDAFRNPALADNRINTLENKLGAVIHQIQAGAHNSSIAKLQNDVKSAVANWLTTAYTKEVNKKIDEIINLIKGIVPPPPPTKPDFAIDASPRTLAVEQNESIGSTIIVQSLNGFNQTVSLSITSQPVNGIYTSIAPSQVRPPANGTADAVLTIKAALNATPNIYAITVQGTNGTIVRQVNIMLTVTAIPTEPDFIISAQPTRLTVQQGSSNTSLITVASVVDFSEPVSLAITSAHIVGVNTTVQPTPVTPLANQSALSMLSVKAANSTLTGNYTLIVTGSSVQLQHSVSIELTVKEAVTPPPVTDVTPPTITEVQRTRVQPAYNESVTVTALVYDLDSGIMNVKLNYTTGSQSTLLNMSLSQGLFTAVVPAFAFNSTVEYRVIAGDNAGNTAYSILYSYTVTDPYPPLLQIDSPLQGNYVRGTVPIVVSMKDQNSGEESGFAQAELSLNSSIVKVWNPPAPAGTDTHLWDTALGPDGVYTVRLTVHDRAGNSASKSLVVTVDNGLPVARIDSPANGSFLGGKVLVTFMGLDLNFDKMELRIDNALVKTSLLMGGATFELNTLDYVDQIHRISLTVFDKAGNTREVSISVTVDNSPPTFAVPSWVPKEPGANVPVQVNITVFEPSYGSGVANVTLWYRNETMEDWLHIPMQFSAGYWTAIIRNQSDTTIEFYVEAFDRAGNHSQTDYFDFTVSGPAGFSLVWLLLIVIILLAIVGGAAAYLYVRRRKKKGEETARGGAPLKPVPPQPPTSMTKSESVVSQSAAPSATTTAPLLRQGYGMISFLVAAHNEENTINERVNRAFERATSHKGPSEIIVVDDGSQDGTYEAAWTAIKTNRVGHPNVPAKVVKLSTPIGKEEATEFGRRKAKGETIEIING